MSEQGWLSGVGFLLALFQALIFMQGKSSKDQISALKELMKTKFVESEADRRELRSMLFSHVHHAQCVQDENGKCNMEMTSVSFPTK